jgi:hypothetical protein
MALSPVDALVVQLTDAIRAQIIAEIRGMSLDEIMALAGGEGHNGGWVSSGRSGRQSLSENAPEKRRPGRAKKAATVATPKRGGRPPSLSATSKLKLHERVVEMLRGSSGVPAEKIRKALSVKKGDLVKVLAHGLEAGTIKKTGERRATKYYAVK